ncbi:unnamed protein product [Urochloa humidicola]
MCRPHSHLGWALPATPPDLTVPLDPHTDEATTTGGAARRRAEQPIDASTQGGPCTPPSFRRSASAPRGCYLSSSSRRGLA